MAKIKKRGASGAAKNYITRTQAVKKLQVSLSDFRRLCILKGIFPRQPRHVKRANKGNNAPTSFYYAKDIQFLHHEPVLNTLREHKSFAKKLSKAIGKQEWSLAKSLQDHHQPVVRLDHIIKQRYPTFNDSLRDVDDALCLLNLFAHLPVGDGDRGKHLVNEKLVGNCTTLCAQWQVYLMKTKSLRKIFLSIKGVYFQAEVRGQTVTWLVPYLFTQHVSSHFGRHIALCFPVDTFFATEQIPDDVDFRIMLTFLELYQTLMGFVMYKLYTDENLVYPPHLDVEKDNAGAGVGAITLTENSADVLAGRNTGDKLADATQQQQTKKAVSAREVKRQIKAITANGSSGAVAEVEGEVVPDQTTAMVTETDSDQFTTAPSRTAAAMSDADGAGLPTLADLEANSGETNSALSIFEPYFFYISRECPRSLVEFVLRCFGAQVDRIGWDMVAGSGSALEEHDARITHHFVDRPVPVTEGEANPYDGSRHPGKRVYVQPQWLIDSANAGKILPAEPYAPGKTLPPHLSPFVNEDDVRRKGGYVPAEAGGSRSVDAAAEEDDDDDDSEEEQDDDAAVDADDGEEFRPALQALLEEPQDATGAGLLEAAELEAEAAGGEEEVERVRSLHTSAAASLKKRQKQSSLATSGPKAQQQSQAKREEHEEKEAKEMARMLMSNRQRKLYNKVSHSQGQKGDEKKRLEEKKRALIKQQSKKAKKPSA